MKKQMLYHIAVSVLFLVFGGISASAQSHEQLMTVQVPFDFQVGRTLLPAGKYLIKRDSQNPQILQIQSSDQKIWALVNTFPLSPSKRQSGTSLMFKGYDDKHFLSEVRFSSEGTGYLLIESKAERKLALAARTHDQMISGK